MYDDKELARQMMHKSVNRVQYTIDPKALFLGYKLGLLEGEDIFGESAYSKQ